MVVDKCEGLEAPAWSARLVQRAGRRGQYADTMAAWQVTGQSITFSLQESSNIFAGHKLSIGHGPLVA